jgi:hypothetical protein
MGLGFKELLTHTSGFGQLPNNACGNGIAYADLKTIVANGVTASNIGQPQYGNCNFALLRELMAPLQGHSLKNAPDGPPRAKQSLNLYITYLNAHVFQPVGIPNRQCELPAGNDILSYTFPAGSTSGTDWGDWSLTCGNGGWVMSADDIFKVVNDLATGNKLLTNSEKKQMFSDCLGWDCSVRNDCPSPYDCKNGDLNDGNGIAVWTYAGVLKCNVARGGGSEFPAAAEIPERRRHHRIGSGCLQQIFSQGKSQTVPVIANEQLANGNWQLAVVSKTH